MSIDDDLPDWIAIAVALAAFLVALVTLWTQLVDRRRADAASVDVFFDAASNSPVVRNAGAQSIYDLRVRLIATGTDLTLTRTRVFRLAPGDSAEFTPTASVPGADLMGPEILGVRADFADWAGRRWTRTNSGSLRRSRPWNRVRI